MGLARKRTHDLASEDRRFVGRTSDPEPNAIVSAQGSRVADARGRSFIDFRMGWCVGNLGWNRAEIVERLRQFDGPFYVAPGDLYAPWVELARRLAEVTPGKLARSFRAVGGTEAVEQALQIAMAFTERTKLVSIEGAYHGNSFGALSIGDRERAPRHLEGCKQLAPPLDDKALDRLDTLLKHRDVAALIMEPIVINLGVEIPTAGFMRGARELCDRYGTLVIFDEVATGFGRTGTMFAAEHYDVTPDIMTLGKAITSGHAPLAATITTTEIAEAIRGQMAFYSTYGWHPLAVAASLATLEYWADHHDELMANIAERSADLAAGLAAMPWKHAPQLRMKGLAIAIKLDDAKYIAKIAERCRDGGLLIGEEDEYLQMFPALTVDRDTTFEALGIIERAVSE